MIDVNKLIYDLLNVTGCNDKRIANARKVCMMWLWLKEQIYTKGGCGISADIDRIEEKYFPMLETRVISIKVELPINEGHARITQIKNYTENKLKIFKDVKEVNIE